MYAHPCTCHDDASPGSRRSSHTRQFSFSYSSLVPTPSFGVPATTASSASHCRPVMVVPPLTETPRPPGAPDGYRRAWLMCFERSTVKNRPADVVPQPLVVEYELADCLRELVTLPSAFESSCDVALAFRRGRTCGLDGVGGRTEFVRGHVCDGP